MRWPLKLIALLFGLLVLSPGVSWACECEGDTLSPKDKYKISSAVFVGKVRSIQSLSGESLVEFWVFKKIKGDLGMRVKVSVPLAGSKEAECGLVLHKNEKYLIYAYGVAESRKDIYQADGCANIKQFRCASTDLKYFERNALLVDKQLEGIK